MNGQVRRQQERTWKGRKWRPRAVTLSEQHSKQGCPVLAGPSRTPVKAPFHRLTSLLEQHFPPLDLYVSSHGIHTSLNGGFDQQEPGPGPTWLASSKGSDYDNDVSMVKVMVMMVVTVKA